MNLRRQLLILVGLRLVLVSLVSAAVLSSATFGPSASQFMRLFLLAVYVLSGIYLLFWRYTDRPRDLYHIQFFVDLVLASLLLHLSGGIDSPFSSFYVFIIVYASLLRDRKGAILAVTLSIIFYVGTSFSRYLGADWLYIATNSDVVYRVLWNVLGFVSVGLLGTFLSERLVTAKQELGHVKLIHDNIINSIRTGLMTLDLKGGITSVNRAAEEICGLVTAELISRPITEVFPANLLDTITRSDFQPVSKPLRIEFWFQKNDREALFLGTSCSPLLSPENQQLGYILSFQDLTEIRKREEELQVKEKMAAIGQVAAGLAHEIRNPLGALSGSIQVLESELQLSSQQSRLLGIILRECNRLNKTVADFLTYAGPSPLRLQNTDLQSLIRDTVALFSNSPDISSDAYRIEVHFDDKIECMADADQLRQAVWNILQNAVRAMPKGGKIEIRGTTSEQAVRLRISDQGVGMSAEERKKIFQPFHTSFPGGVGLGMAIVYQIVQQHQGQIAIESRVNRGTTIEITLPRLAERIRSHPRSVPARV